MARKVTPSQPLSSGTVCSISQRCFELKAAQQNDANDDEALPARKTDEEWRSVLDKESYYVLRERGTEAPGSSILNNLSPTASVGTLVCKACGNPLYNVNAKYESGTGWPSFTHPINREAIEYSLDFDAILPRTECLCSQCGSHLGHVFDDGPALTGLRYCMNGIAMEYRPRHDEANVEGQDASSMVVSVVAEEEPPMIASQLPLGVVWPSVMFNLGIVSLFVSSFASRWDPSAPVGQQLLQFAFPIPVALFYSYNAFRSLARIER